MQVSVNIYANYKNSCGISEEGKITVVLAVKEEVRFELGVDRTWVAKDALSGKWEWEGLCVGMQRPT